ncbi:MAG: helix-turn-helix transcriptional regulator [Bacteroidales bacterium]|nr:helix-turn-helix transcriptional regulator [Bacteroidales bacterium]
MNERLLKFLEAENITQAQFADSIGVARASISHIVSGRNKPGFDFIERTAKRFPALNIEWLITGKGRMYNSQEDMTLFQDPEEPYSPADFQPLSKSKKVSRVIVFFEDGTFEEFK